MGLLVPQVLSTLSTVCGQRWKAYCSQGAACNTGVNVTLILGAWLLAHLGHLAAKKRQTMLGGLLEVAAVVFLWIEIFAVLSVGKSGKGMVVYLWCMGILTVFPVLSLVGALFPKNMFGPKRRRVPAQTPFTGIHFPLFNLKGEHHLL